MHIEENLSTSSWQIGDITNGSMTLNGQTYTQPVLLTEHGLTVGDWQLNDLNANTILDILSSQNTQPEILLIGTGQKQQFLHPKITASLASKGIGMETMTTAAACRTGLILQSEGRKVFLWLWP